jgi:hypothetical protein
LRKLVATELKRDGSIRLPLPANGPVSVICRPPLHAGEVIPVKSPFSIACVGTNRSVVAGLLRSTRP